MNRGWLLVALLALMGSGCDDMSRQPRVQEQRPAALFADGMGTRQPPAGTVARGQLEREAVLQRRPPMSSALLVKGEERYRIFCTPCHGLSGQGDGLVVGRGFPAPAPLSDKRMRALSDEHLLRVIADGQGLMAGYRAVIAPEDRWAIIAHLRALQLSQHAPLSSLTGLQRQALEAQPQ